MENYQSINKTIASIKKPIIAFSLIQIALYVAIGYALVQIALNKESHSYSSMETCYYGMDSIFNNNPNEELLNKTILKDLLKKKEEFKVDSIHLVKVVNNYECDVFSKDQKGVRRYLVKLEKNAKFRHLYRILDISEKTVDSRYQI
jgi:hypothetical protein